MKSMLSVGIRTDSVRPVGSDRTPWSIDSPTTTEVRSCSSPSNVWTRIVSYGGIPPQSAESTRTAFTQPAPHTATPTRTAAIMNFTERALMVSLLLVR